jgi:hypothetical protein
MLGLFSLLRDYLPNFAHIAKPLTHLKSKRVAERISFSAREREAFGTLQALLCKAANEPWRVIDPIRTYTLLRMPAKSRWEQLSIKELMKADSAL